MRTLRLPVVFVAALILCGVLLAQSNVGPAAAPPSKPQFFAGVVASVDDHQVVVSRSLIGRNPETRVFVINGDTKVNRGALKAKSRVTVRYQHLPEGDVALEIQIHRSRFS
jgi:hypothetical protein